jgi:hypothetical protein
VVLTEQTQNLKSGQTQPESTRRKFVDEYVYERLFLASKPFTATILKALAVSRRDRTLNCSRHPSVSAPAGDDNAFKVSLDTKPKMLSLQTATTAAEEEEGPRAPGIKRATTHASCSQIPPTKNLQGQILPYNTTLSS